MRGRPRLPPHPDTAYWKDVGANHSAGCSMLPLSSIKAANRYFLIAAPVPSPAPPPLFVHCCVVPGDQFVLWEWPGREREVTQGG